MPETQPSRTGDRLSFGPPKDDACMLGTQLEALQVLAEKLGKQETPELEAERAAVIQALQGIEVPQSPEFRSPEMRATLVTLRERLRGLEPPKKEGEKKRIIKGDELTAAVAKKLAEK